ncbi:DUF6817 domain-containing protein [Micromonospora endolithica]|uniref:DUF6817 domain-containing protein n=1 Tax=Micromonospora endolithica TaxID=230091 RepID=A0A3A9YTG0_9ACTN|nr:hypothetical protein [Micromonospora endolithica]RKN39331.1 hypothetical protein D7223_28805 [Micromonospora endolithica]TWJ22747.1 hypothetical protein JD76_02869 [Micromonospora endolithica]
MSADVDVRAWLRSRGTETIQHPGGTLYAHLCRVEERLADLGHGADLRSAGLTHAAYGTDGFGLALLDWSDRATLRNLVGHAAEALVYLYGACDRRSSWQGLAATGEVTDRFTGRVVRLDADQLTPYVDLSVVNELDVIEQDPSLLDRHGDYFRGLFRSWAPVVSPPLVERLRRVLDR